MYSAKIFLERDERNMIRLSASSKSQCPVSTYNVHVTQRRWIVRNSGKQVFYADYFFGSRMRATAQQTKNMPPFLVIHVVFDLRQFRLQKTKHFQIVRNFILKVENGKLAALLQRPEMMCE